HHDFEVFIDPNGDSQEYYEIEINALGTGWDLLLPRPYKDGGRAVHDWEIAGLRSAVHLDGTLNDPSDIDRRWTVQLAFPRAPLRHRPLMDGRAGVPLARAGRGRAMPESAARRRPVARQLLARRVVAAHG